MSKKSILALILAGLSFALLTGKIDLPHIPIPDIVVPVKDDYQELQKQIRDTKGMVISSDRAQVITIAESSTSLQDFHSKWMDQLGAASLLAWSPMRDAVRDWCVVNQPTPEQETQVLKAIAAELKTWQ